MKQYWETLFFSSLIVVALLLFQLTRSELNNKQLAKKQRALVGQIAVMSKEPVRPDSAGGKSGDRQYAESNGALKSLANAETDSWRKRREPFLQGNALRVAWTRYHEAIAKLNLPHDKQAQLLSVLRDREESWIDAKEAATSLGIGDPQEFRQALAAARISMNDKIVALVGDSGLDMLDNSAASMTQETIISGGVGADLAMDGIPLTPEQETGLAQVFADVSKQFPKASAYESIIQQRADGEFAVLDKAAAILTADQMADLKSYIEWANQRAIVLAERPRYPPD
jgi:hypothetical protein